MEELSEVEAVLASLLDAVVTSVKHSQEAAQDAEVLPIGGYLWKFPSEGSNRADTRRYVHPPPTPQIREYPRKCDQCGLCWVSDHDFELDHLRWCSFSRDIEVHEDTCKQRVASLGVARRVWCEVDGSFSRLQWRFGVEVDADNTVCPTNSIVFADITGLTMLDEPTNSFQIVTSDGRIVVFQWRPEERYELEDTSGLVPYRLKLDAHQWQEYLDELSKYARSCPSDGVSEYSLRKGDWPATALFKEVSLLLLSENVIQDTGRVLERKLCSILAASGHDTQHRSLVDNDGNSLVHLAIGLNLEDRSSAVVAMLLGMGADCNLQNHERESPLLLVAASGDLATAKVLLAAPSIQVDLPGALGVTAFHAAANAGDVKMLQLLCEAGAQPEARDDNGWTALHYAAACSSGLKTLHFLCELLTDEFIDAQCSEGNTALHVAAGCGCFDNVRALLETAASPHICSFSGESPYHLALRNNHIQCAVAINDYQSIPLKSYTEPSSRSAKEITVSEATAVVLNESGAGQVTHSEEGEWVTCLTQDGHAYYYNSITGETSWYKPGEYQLPETWGTVEYEERDHDDKTSENDASYCYALPADQEAGSILGDHAGHQLSLCLIPMVSPLTSLDNPTAAAKYEAVRRRARKQRKRRQSKLHLIHHQDGREDEAF